MRRRAVVLATLMMFALLVLTLDAQSLWWDEGISLHLATSSWAEIVADRATNIHPPLYFFALKVWVSLVGANAFTGRLFSVFAIVLIPALAFRFLEQRLRVRVPWYGTFIVAFASPLIVYGQETRAYAWLALFWMSLIDRAWCCLSTSPTSKHQVLRDGFVNALLEVCFVLFHYSGIFGVIVINLAFLIDFLKTRNRVRLRSWLVSMAAVIVGGLLWLIPVMYYGINNLTQHAGISNVMAAPVAWDYVVRLLATFQVFGVPSISLEPAWLYFIGLALASAVIALLYAMTEKDSRRTTLFIIAVWLLPFLAAPFIWASSPQSHPRYLMPYMLGGGLLMLWLTSVNTVPKVLRVLLTFCVIAVSGVGIYRYFTDENLQKSDVRALAMILREYEGSSVLVVPATDWAISQYDTGDVVVVMALEATADFDAWYAGSVVGYDTVYLLDYGRDVLDTAGRLRSTLVNHGWFEQRIDAHGVFLEQYSLGTPVTALTTEVVDACTEHGLCLANATVPENVVSGAQTGIHLEWQLMSGSLENRYALALRLYAPSGALVASLDDLLITTRNQPTDYWPVVESIDTYHVLDIPTGALPVGYTLRAGVYEVNTPDTAITFHRQDKAASADVVIGTVTPWIEPWRIGDSLVPDDSVIIDGLSADLDSWGTDRGGGTRRVCIYNSKLVGEGGMQARKRSFDVG